MERLINKPILCDESVCTGCEACANSCPESCISMLSDDNGFLHPSIDSERCTGCKECENSCPVLHRPPLIRDPEPNVFACWHNNDEIRMRSSSGGLFSALAEYILAQGGIVYGAAYDDNLHVHHIGIEHLDGLEKLRRSKYVQSQIGNTFINVKQYLEEDRHVLYVGTPCQISGLYSFLKKDYDHLTTVDLICGGVPSPKVFAGYVQSIENYYNVRLSEINFRNKIHGWENNAVIGVTKTDQYHLKGNNNYYFGGYILHTFLRDSCYQCPMVGLPRVGDITIGDFWGIQKSRIFNQTEIDKGISLMMINRKDIELQIIPFVKKRLMIVKRSLTEARAENSPMFNPPCKPINRADFFLTLINMASK